MHYLLFYEVADDYIRRRAELRNMHLKLGWEAAERGELVLGGALANPGDGAVLLFKGDSPKWQRNLPGPIPTSPTGSSSAGMCASGPPSSANSPQIPSAR